MKFEKIKIGIFTSLSFYIVFHILYLLILKINWWEDDVLKYFMPGWTLVIFFVGFGLAGKYYSKKSEYYPEPLPDNFDFDKVNSCWEIEKMFIKYKVVYIGKILFGASVPFLILGYWGEGKCSVINIVKVLILAVLTLICWYYEYRIKKKLDL
jgi:hypothetical protein